MREAIPAHLFYLESISKIKSCHAELGSASIFVEKIEIPKQVRNDTKWFFEMTSKKSIFVETFGNTPVL